MLVKSKTSQCNGETEAQISDIKIAQILGQSYICRDLQTKGKLWGKVVPSRQTQPNELPADHRFLLYSLQVFQL
jgi:hypothetical protein